MLYFLNNCFFPPSRVLLLNFTFENREERQCTNVSKFTNTCNQVLELV